MQCVFLKFCLKKYSKFFMFNSKQIGYFIYLYFYNHQLFLVNLSFCCKCHLFRNELAFPDCFIWPDSTKPNNILLLSLEYGLVKYVELLSLYQKQFFEYSSNIKENDKSLNINILFLLIYFTIPYINVHIPRISSVIGHLN